MAEKVDTVPEMPQITSWQQHHSNASSSCPENVLKEIYSLVSLIMLFLVSNNSFHTQLVLHHHFLVLSPKGSVQRRLTWREL